MSIVVFWIQASPTDFFPGMSEPRCRRFSDLQLTEALTFCHQLREKEGVSHTVISSKMDGMVGEIGVDALVDGRTPAGEDYAWLKRREM